MNRFLAIAAILTLTVHSAFAQGGLVVQSYDGQGRQSITGVSGPAPAPAAAAPAAAPRPSAANADETLMSMYNDGQRQGVLDNGSGRGDPGGIPSDEEYRGYNGRNLVQAYLSCKYEVFRAAPPGDRSKGIMEKMRIRMYVMDVCMNREGFFRDKPMGFLDLNMMTSADIFRW